MRVDEHSLPEFREEHLSPRALVDLVEQFVRVLVRVAVGVGKSTAVDELLASAETYKRFPLVIYLAPAWAVLRERAALSSTTQSQVRCLVVRPRPRERCGPVNAEWEDLEKRGCAAYAKATLCRTCPEASAPQDPCTWPRQLQDIKGIGLVFAAEQQLALNRALVLMLLRRSSAGRVLVIIDEGRSLDASFESVLSVEELARFEEAVRKAGRDKKKPSGRVIRQVSEVVRHLVRADNRELASDSFAISPHLNLHAFRIQRAGLDLFGPSFRYIGYDLVQLRWSESDSRWRDGSGDIHFTARPYLRCHVLFLSAHLTGPYVGHRLGQGPVESPFDNFEFLHTKTRFVNLRSRLGVDKYFKRNSPQILDTIAVLIARNIADGRSTLLVSRKKSKGLVERYLTGRLAGWGLACRLVAEDYSSLPAAPKPHIIPILHYGILGVNDFVRYESAYCVNSYYISDRELNRVVQEAEPDVFRVRLEISSGPGKGRRVRVAARGLSAGDLVGLGNEYLRRLEVDPVVQAVGRVRFVTLPREVLTFQMNDLRADVVDVRDVASLVELRQILGVPSARQVDEVTRGEQARRLMSAGLTAKEAAGRIGVSRATLFRAQKAAKSLKTPLSNYLRSLETFPACPAEEERRA